jgi:hypothetical protein
MCTCGVDVENNKKKSGWEKNENLSLFFSEDKEWNKLSK